MSTLLSKKILLPLLMIMLAAPAALASPSNSAMRQRVMANIAASRQARESSGYRKWSQQLRAGTLRRAPVKLRNATRGPNTVPDKFVVQGGGSQPNTVFNKSDRKMKRYIRRKAAKLRMSPSMKPWDKVDRIQKIIRDKVKHAGNELDYKKNPNWYNGYNKRNKSAGKLAMLGDYLKKGKVVCREMAFLTQVALEDAGFESRLARGDLMKKGKRVGGHAWNEIKLDGSWYMVDTTNPQFNKTTPKVAGTTGTRNGWIWKRDSSRYVIEPSPALKKQRQQDSRRR